MKLKPKDIAKLRQFGLKFVFRPPERAPTPEAAAAFLAKGELADGRFSIPRQTVLDSYPGSLPEALDLSGGLRVTYSVTTETSGDITRWLAVSRGDFRLGETLVRSVMNAVGFGEGTPVQNDSKIWHVRGKGAPPGPSRGDA